jgi:RHS repeat-associated protein
MVGQTYSTPMVALVPSDPQNPGGFVVTNRRAYDAWGMVRQGAAAAEPWQRYCANLGHVQDDESGLIYMRARYYEPWSGRCVSEDPAEDGRNWFIYGSNDPVNRIDHNGREDEFERFIIACGLFLVGFVLLVGVAPEGAWLNKILSNQSWKIHRDIGNVKGQMFDEQFFRKYGSRAASGD